MIIIFAGSIGRLPVGGHAWIDMQYLSGLKALGHDVYYFEDCGDESWVYNWDIEELTTELSYPADYVRDCLEPLGFKNRWIYRAGNQSEGMSIESFREICAQADLMIVRAVPLTIWRDEYLEVHRRCYIDADPGFNQISLINGNAKLAETLNQCERLFTIGQRIGAADCPIPDAGYNWLKTVAPVSLPDWRVAENEDASHFTSVMQWRGFHDVVYKGLAYGQKDKEFPRFLKLPQLVSQPFRLALTGSSPENFTEYGWEVVPGWVASKTTGSYQSFIQESRAEFGVAKHGYVAMRGGWFSDRSVCYLASGRPVLVEDTGLRDWLPVGEGIVTFSDISEAVRGVESINAEYERHCHAAREIAEQYFAASLVLPLLIEEAMN
ncbi:MAG TPA: hypothetical protein VK308_13410 [Pyrinomonadaceae bacterium]|nr:hypothetical protein [Pyrinomonadaceae bacterium]